MKICFFADSESIHTVRWCKHFQELGHEVHLISFKNVEIPSVFTYNVNKGAINVHGGNWKLILNFRKVKKLLKQISPDVFHSMYATSYGITGALTGFHPYVITALGSDLLISPKESKMYQILLKFAFKKADLVTLMSNQMMEEALKLGAEAKKLIVLPFGIDPEIFNARTRSVPDDSFVITSTRNFEDVYNIPHLLKAVAKIKENIPNLKLNLIGKGSKEAEIRQLVKELGLDHLTKFYGSIRQPEIAKILNVSHVFVSVSISDGNNISLNEAMACESYCIATNIPANVQWIDNGKNGTLVEINDIDGLANALNNAYENYGTLQEKAVPMNQQIILEKGLWTENMKRMENEYQRLISLK